MKKVRLLIVVLFFFLFSSYSFAQRYWIATTASNWNNTANWSTTATGSGGSSVPGSGDLVFFTASRQGNCTLDVAPTVNGMSVSGYNGIIDLAGNVLTTNGTSTFTSGTVADTNGGALLQINGTSTVIFNGTLIKVPVTGTTGRIFLSGSTFESTFSIIKTVNNTDNSAGGNTFGGAVTITNASSAGFMLSSTNPDIFNSTLTINQNSSGTIDIARVAANTQFNGNISINYNATGNIAFGSGGGTSSLAAGSTISVGGFGASGCGNLSLARFTQLGSTNQNITLGGSNASSALTLGPASTFNGSITASAPVFVLNTSTFVSPVNFTQTGGSVNSNSRGGNLFQNTVSISNTGDADIYLGSTAADAGDVFNGDATFYALGGGRIRVGQSNTGNRFNGSATFYSSGPVDLNTNRIQISRLANSEVTFNGSATFINNGLGSDVHISYDAGSSTTFNGPVTFTSTGTASGSTPREVLIGVDGNVIFNNNLTLNNTTSDGIQMSNGTGTVTMAAGYSIFIGATGFTDGTLELTNFTQAGSAPMSLALTGNALLQAGPNLSIGGDVVFSAPRVYLNGGTYARTTSIEKTGAVDDYGRGGNTFSGATSILNSGSGSFVLANTNPDIFNGAVTFTNTGSSYIYPAYNSTNNQFNENIIVNSIGSSLGIRISNNNSGTSVLAAGKTISVGALGYTTGELRLRRFTQSGSTAQNLTLTNSSQLYVGPLTEFQGDVNFAAPRLFLQGGTYTGAAYLEKTGAGNDDSAGGNVFSAATTLVNSGSGWFRNAVTSLDTFNGDLTLTNTGTATIRMADNIPGTVFNGNIVVNNTNGGGVYFCNNVNGNATLANGKAISVGASGFSTGTLLLTRFTQSGPASQALTLTGTSILTLGPTSSFDGAVDFRSPQLFFNNTSFNGTTFLEKTGMVDNASNGNNTFTSGATIKNSGAGFLRTNGNNTFGGATSLINTGSNYLLLELSTGSTYNGDLTLINTGSSTIRMAYQGTSNFNGNIQVNNTSNSGIYFCELATATATLANGKTISVGATGFTAGELRLNRFTQNGSANQSLMLTGTSVLTLGPTSSFGGNVDFRSPQLFLDATVFSGTTFLEKTGAVDNASNGNSIFSSTTTIKNSGTGYFRTNGNNTFGGATSLINTGSNYLLLELSTGSTYNGDLTLINTGSSTIRMAYQGTSNFNGNIQVNNTTNNGIYFCELATATATLANGKAISVGATGFAAGELRLSRFTQIGSTSQNLALTGASTILTVGPNSSFDGAVDFRSPQLFFSNTLFNGTAFLEKTGAVDNTSIGNSTFGSAVTIKNSGTGFLRSNGNNTFGGPTSLINTGSNDLLLELTTGSTYNGDVTLTNAGTSTLRTVYRGASNFNGNILVNNISGNGIYFSEHASGSSTLAGGKTIAVGAGGFATGTLWLQHFTQNSSSAQNIVLTGTATFNTGSSSVWNGSITVSTPSIFLNGNTFNGITNSFTKTGTTTDNSIGGNTFATGTTSTFINAGSGTFRLANIAGDNFSGAAVFVQSSGTLNPAYNSATTFAGDITTNGVGVITFGVAGGGSSTFTGADNQSINRAGGVSPVFTRLIMNKTGGVVTLNTDISITLTGTFTSGVMNTTATNYVNFANGATSSVNALGNNASYIDGPVRKTGTNLFSFPTGNAGIFRPISISAPSASTVFTAQYFKASPPYGGLSTYDPSFVTVSGCEYWILDRTSGAGNANVTLSWVASDCAAPYITNPSTLRVTRWNTTSWVNQGNGGVTGSAASGTVTTSAPVTSFSPFTIASTTLSNPLPIELVDFTASVTDNQISLNWITESELNNDFFSIERSADGMEFSVLGTVKGAGTTSQQNKYAFIDRDLSSSLFYYRLRQTDFDKKSTYSKVIRVSLTESTELIAYPNPAPKGTVRINSKGDFALYNNLGQMVAKVIDSNQMDVSQLPSGIYTLRSSNGRHFRLVIE